MRAVIIISVLLGLVWNTIAVTLLGGRVMDAFKPSWLLAGAIAGAVAGWFTIWSRNRREGEERLLDGFATFYLGIVIYWISFVVIERAVMCVKHGGWTDFDLRDHLTMIGIFLLYGTLWYGIVLIPLCFLSRWLIWKVYQRFAD